MKNLKISISREFNCTGDCQFCIKNDYLGDVYDKPETGEKLKHPYFYCNGTIYKINYDGMLKNQFWNNSFPSLMFHFWIILLGNYVAYHRGGLYTTMGLRSDCKEFVEENHLELLNRSVDECFHYFTKLNFPAAVIST